MASTSNSSIGLLRLTRPFITLFFIFLYTSMFMFTLLEAHQTQNIESMLGRRILAKEKKEEEVVKKKATNIEHKNQIKPIKTIKINSNSTTKAKPIKPLKYISSNSTTKAKPFKLTTNSTTTKTTLSKSQAKNLTSNSIYTTKPIKNSPNLLKSNASKNNTTSSTTKKTQVSTQKEAKLTKKESNELSSKKSQTSIDKIPKEEKKNTKDKTNKSQPTKLQKFNTDPDEDDDLISEFRDLPYKFQEAILPDLERISTTSKAYIYRANKEITQGFKPLVGNKYASIIASLTSCIFLLLPLLLVSLLFSQIKTFISLQKIIIFIQVYLAIYFAILALAYFATGLEPLKFFYATSRPSYITMQVFQTLGYVLLILLQILNLVLVFSTKESGLGLKFLGLGQTIVGLAVGLHYYTTVFHRAVVGNPPKTSWKVNAIYATCFFVICLFARAERRKKAYLQEDGEDDDKKS